MKNKAHLLAAFAVATLVFALDTPRTAQAEGFGCTVVKGITCVVVGDDWGGAFALKSDKCQTVVTPSGNTKVTCILDIPKGYAPTKAEVRRGFPAATFLGITTDTQTVTTPAGKVIFTCYINGSSK